MTNYDKVLKGFEIHTKCELLGYSDCPYLERMGKFDCVEKLQADVIAMQDGVKPEKKVDRSGTFYDCGVCGRSVGGTYFDGINNITDYDNYCCKCGTKVKWND